MAVAVRGLGRWKYLLGALTLVTAFMLGTAHGPFQAGAWPWDDEREYTISGQVNCSGFSVTAENRYPYPELDWFTIRGRDDVFTRTSAFTGTYSVNVPPGWVIEWDMSCDGQKYSDKFEVGKRIVGSSYHQTRHICSEDIGLQPCTDTDIGGCAVLYFQGVIPTKLSFEEAIATWSDYYDGGLGPIDDAKACIDALTSLRSEQTPPTPVAPVPTIPPLPHEPIPPAETVTTLPPGGSDDDRGASPTPPAPTTTTTTTPSSTTTTSPPHPKPWAANLQAYAHGGGRVGVTFDAGWQGDHDPIKCNFYMDGALLTEPHQCGVKPSHQFTVSPGQHTFFATVTDEHGVESDRTNEVTITVT